MGCSASIARSGAVDVVKREDVEQSGYSAAMSTAHSRFSLTISRTCTEGPINASNSQHPASRKAATTTGIVSGSTEPHGPAAKSSATAAGGVAPGSGPAGAPGSPTPSSKAGSSAPGSPQSQMPTPGSSPVSPLDLGGPAGAAGAAYSSSRGGLHAAASAAAAASQQKQPQSPQSPQPESPQQKPVALPGIPLATAQGLAGAASAQAPSPFVTTSAAAATGSNGSDLGGSGRAPAPATPPASSAAAGSAAAGFAGGVGRLDSSSSSAGGSPARLPCVPHPVGGFFDSRPSSPTPLAQQAAGSTSASVIATATSGDIQAATESGGGAPSGAAGAALSAPPRPAWARKLLGGQASGGISALSSPLSSEAAPGREALSRQSSGLHAGGMPLLPPILGVPLPPAAAAALMSSAGSSRLNSSRVLPALGSTSTSTSTSGVPPVVAAPSAPAAAAAAAPSSPVHCKSALGPAPAQTQTLPHPATVVAPGAGPSVAAASAPVPVPTPAAAALQGSGANTPSLSNTPPTAAIHIHPAAAAPSATSRAEPPAVATSPPRPSAAVAPLVMPRSSAPPVLLPTGSSAAAPAAPSLAAAAAAVSSSPSGGGRGGGGGGVAPSPASLTAGSRGSRTAGLSAVRGGLVTLAYVEAFLRTHVLGRGPGSGLMTTRQVVEHVIAPACAAAGCRFPDAPPPAVPASPSAAHHGAGHEHEHALGIPPRAATSPCTIGCGSTSASGATPSPDSSNSSSNSSSGHPSSSTSSSGAAGADAAGGGGGGGGSRPVGGPLLHLRDWAACSLPGGGAAAGSAAASAAAPSGRYCYVVHAADCCFADVVGLLRSHLAGVPPEEAVLWFDIFALPQEPEPSPSAASSPSGHHLAHHHAGFMPGGSGASFSSSLPAGRAARVDAARAAIAHAGSVLLCLLPPSAGCPSYATRTTSARHLQLQARLAPALALPGGSEDPAGTAAGAEAGGLPLPLRRTWCLWELSTALRLRGPSALVVLEGAGCGDGVSAAVPEDGGATAAANSFPVPRATCGGGLWLAAGVSRARSLSLTRSQLGGTLAPTPQHAADRAALIADMVANTVQPAAAATATASAAVAAAAGHLADCADLGGCAAGDVDAVESALRLFFALAPTGYGEELAELALRAAPEQAPAARGAPALPGSGPGGSSAAATANAPGAASKNCWRFDALWAALSDEAGPRCVVVAAPPGAGKSTFAAALACPPPTPPTAPQPPAWRSVAALHLCHAADGRRQDALRVVRSLAFQLAARFPACRAALAAEMMSASSSVSVMPSSQQPSATQLEDAVEALLVKPLAALAAATAAHPPPPLILLIDGVDERGPPTGAGSKPPQQQPQPQPPPASPSGSELCSPRPPSTPPRAGGGGGRPCPVRSPSAAAAAAAAGGAGSAIASSPSGNFSAAAAATSSATRGPFPLAQLVAVLLRRLPSHVRLLLTAEQPPKCDANSSSAGADTPAVTVAAGLDLAPVPDGVASADSVADWLQAGPVTSAAAAANGGRRAAAAGSDTAHAAPAAGGCRVLPLTSLRDDFALAASLHQQLLLRAGPEGALPLTAALLVRGGPRLAFYVTCLRLHALPTLATAPEKLPLTMDAAWEMLFDQDWRAGGGGAVGLVDTEKTTARRLLAVLAAAQEPLPVALLSALGLATALPLLPGWGTGLFVEDLPQRRVRVASGPLAAWLRGGAATAAGGKAAAAYGADVAAGHAILAAQLYDMCGRAAAAATGTGSSGAAPAAALPGAIAAYAARHLHTHLAAAIALAPASPQLQQLQQKLQQLEQHAQQAPPPLQASTSGRLRLTLPAEGGPDLAPRAAAAPAAVSAPAPVPAGPTAALKQPGGAAAQPLPSLSQLDAWAAHLGVGADTPRTSLAGASTRKPPQEPPRGPPAPIAV